MIAKNSNAHPDPVSNDWQEPADSGISANAGQLDFTERAKRHPRPAAARWRLCPRRYGGLNASARQAQGTGWRCAGR